jgi:hypothetical protein
MRVQSVHAGVEGPQAREEQKYQPKYEVGNGSIEPRGFLGGRRVCYIEKDRPDRESPLRLSSGGNGEWFLLWR